MDESNNYAMAGIPLLDGDHRSGAYPSNYPMTGISMPESDLRSSSHLSSAGNQQALYSPAGYMPYTDHNAGPLQQSFSDHTTPLEHATDQGYSNLSDQEIAAALANFQPCNDCTPATKTAIPHHHHQPSGRLAGASATLDGHFCCSWLIHGQPCLLCFESAEALDCHIKSDHAGKDGTYRCLWQDCSKQATASQTSGPMNFGNKPKLMRHVHSHTGYKPFPCPFPGCDRGFVTKEQLKNHETTHTKSRKYQCQQCGKAFAVKSALTTHITAVHDEKKTHSCDICGKAFADSSNLSKHKQTHFRSNTSNGIKKVRSRRGTSTTTRSTPSSLPTPTGTPATPKFPFHQQMQDFSFPPLSPGMAMGMMGPPPPNQLAQPSSAFCSMGPGSSTYSVVSSPPPSQASFDPNCFCCDQVCLPPPGPASPCTQEDDKCDMDGFCDLPDCGVPDECHMPACSDGACAAPPREGPTVCAEGHNMPDPQHWDHFDFGQPMPRWEDLLRDG